MNSIISKYAILNKTTKVRIYQSPDTMLENGEDYDDNDHNTGQNIDGMVLEAGTLIKIFQSKNLSRNVCTIQVLDLVEQNPIYENLYECPQANLQSVSEDLWPFVISIAEPEQRLWLLQDTGHCKWLMRLKINDLVCVSGVMFNKPGNNYDCIIRHIGPVNELYSVGYFFGLELLHLNSGYSPQCKKVPFSGSYIQCKPEWSIFATANWIAPIPKKGRKKLSPRGKVKSAMGPNSCNTGSNTSNTSSLKKVRKSRKNKEPTVQFYDNLEDTRDSRQSKKKMEHERELSNVVLIDNEEFKQTVENREKCLERRATNTVQTQTQPQGSILKNKHNNQVKPAQSLKLNVNGRNNVFGFDKDKQDGGNWSRVVDKAAAIMNKRTSTSASIWDLNSASSSATSNGKSTNNKNKNSNKTQKPQKKSTNRKNILSSVVESARLPVSPLQEIPGSDLGISSVVEVNVPESDENLYGVIRWIGVPPNMRNIMVGVELDDYYTDKKLATTDGSFNGISLFKCPAARGIFVNSKQCSIDRRFLSAIGNDPNIAHAGSKAEMTNGFCDDQQMFGHMECPVAPKKCFSLDELEELCGNFKGIQGYHNSCYLDVTLFSMFAFTAVFDAILYRPCEKNDISEYTKVQKVLREEIVNPLRKHMFVRADRVMKLRKLLDRLGSVSGLTSEEKDPEEFLHCLLSEIMRVEPFLKLNSGQDAYYYQLFVEKDERLLFPTVQQLFEQSFHISGIKLKEVPPCLIIQMPRFGKNFKMYPRIMPSQVLDVTDVIDDSPRQCSVCGKLAEFECRECFGILQGGVRLESTSFCSKCLETVHMHSKRSNHKHRKLLVPQDFRVMAEDMSVPRLYMELFAVVCIETSHYVTFVKAGSGPDAPWCFFDSMAYRKGKVNGYNIPNMTIVPKLPQWLSEDGARKVNETSSNDKLLPEHAKRLFCDAYICMYQSTDVMMYR